MEKKGKGGKKGRETGRIWEGRGRKGKGGGRVAEWWLGDGRPVYSVTNYGR